MARFTEANLKSGISSKGQLSSEQWGVLKRRPKAGWKHWLIGEEFTAKQIKKFIALKDVHIRKREERQRLERERREKEPKIRYGKCTGGMPSEAVIKEIMSEYPSPEATLDVTPKYDDWSWQYKRDEWRELSTRIQQRDNWTCALCGTRSLMKGKMSCHHLLYERGEKIWDVPDCYLITICGKCHKKEHSRHLVAPSRIFDKNGKRIKK